VKTHGHCGRVVNPRPYAVPPRLRAQRLLRAACLGVCLVHNPFADFLTARVGFDNLRLGLLCFDCVC
jgi:hypothetical protein